MNRRERMFALINSQDAPEIVPAAFFMHFDPSQHHGQPAIDRHLEFFQQTGMDLLKIQFELPLPQGLHMQRPADWARAPLYPPEFFEPMLGVVAGLVKAARPLAPVVLTLYSPFMWLRHLDPQAELDRHFKEDPAATARGLAVMTENVLQLVRAAKRLGVDGFYASSQGGEAYRFTGTDIFEKYIKPSDLAVWDELQDCPFNILHICDYEGGYSDLAPFLDYPGQVVNCSLKLGESSLSPRQAAALFGRPFMGGLERKGVLASGTPDEVRQAARAVLAQAPERFILAADCTVPSETAWANLAAAIETAHAHRPEGKTG
jgi:uroporphyrinogen decarboxylase